MFWFNWIKGCFQVKQGNLTEEINSGHNQKVFETALKTGF